MITVRRVFNVAGVTFDGRQELIAKLRGGEDCKIVPEPKNKYDPNALAVHVACEGYVYHIGYIPRELAAQIAPHLDGESVMAKVIEIVGGFKTNDGDTASLGVRVWVEFPTDDIQDTRKW